MGYLIGIDEAGYGPSLGPLVVTATLWRVPGDPLACDLYERLRHVVVSGDEVKKTSRRPTNVQPLVVADSKRVFNRSGGLDGLHGLERAVLPAVALASGPAKSWRDLCRHVAPEVDHDIGQLPWLRDFDTSLPLALDNESLEQATALFRDGLHTADVQLLSVRSRMIFPPRFNQLIDHYGNKATALSETSVGLLAELAEPLNDDSLLAVCDKHGGRNFYAALLQHHFPEHWIEIERETRAESVYRWHRAPWSTTVVFRVEGELTLPTALASMTSKYLREVAMLAFNRFWQTHVPTLRPTAGYYRDAQRFKHDIRGAQRKLGIDDRILWRCR